MKMFILIAMIFCHIVDDYYLQGWLASGKQRNWWIENAPSKKYKHDYIMALIMHSFSWAFMITVPFLITDGIPQGILYYILFAINFIIHAVTDNAKANKFMINLIQDQSIHLIQIAITFLLLSF